MTSPEDLPPEGKDALIAQLLEQLRLRTLELAEAQLQVLAVGQIVDPRVVGKFITVEGLIAPDGHLDNDKACAALDALLVEYPYLAASSHPGIRFLGRP